MKFNSEHFFELLEKEKLAKNSRQSFIYNNEKNYYLLDLYRQMIQDQAFWVKRDQYLDLLISCQSGEFPSRILFEKWEDVVRESMELSSLRYFSRNRNISQHIKDLEELFQGSVNFKAKNFMLLIGAVSKKDPFGGTFFHPGQKSAEIVVFRWTPSDPDPEEIFLNFAGEIILKIKKYLS